MKTTTRSGYILLFTLMIVSLIVLLVSRIFNQGMVHMPYARTMINRQKAEFLALSGISIAISQLTALESEEDKQKAKAKTEKAEGAQPESEDLKLLTRLLPRLNRWQQFNLDEKKEGSGGKIQVCIGCENGKIDLNAIYDFKQKKFLGESLVQGDYKKLMQELFGLIEKISGSKGMFEAFEKFLKERSTPFNDATELLMIKDFAFFKKALFYEPKEFKKGEPSQIYLTDLFTVFSGSPLVEPWLFSDTFITLFELNRPTSDKEKTNEMKEWLKKFKPSSSWTQDWNVILKPVYGKDFATLPKNIGFLLNPKFEPKIFSVLSYGKIGEVTQKLLAILERSAAIAQDASPTIMIKKIYWL